uniref:Uncharacterized protein n=1 Tax=Oryzias melastigma TaxID=30732 RepID=A0A3B3BKM9_ORYME
MLSIRHYQHGGFLPLCNKAGGRSYLRNSKKTDKLCNSSIFFFFKLFAGRGLVSSQSVAAKRWYEVEKEKEEEVHPCLSSVNTMG